MRENTFCTYLYFMLYIKLEAVWQAEEFIFTL